MAKEPIIIGGKEVKGYFRRNGKSIPYFVDGTVGTNQFIKDFKIEAENEKEFTDFATKQIENKKKERVEKRANKERKREYERIDYQLNEKIKNFKKRKGK